MKAKTSINFVKNPDLVLEAALIARDGGKNLSDWLGVEDELIAADLDRCARYQLAKFDLREKKAWAKIQSVGVGARFAGEELKFGEEDE